ncbi:hypothetical protein [Actinokineospora sp.]|uniref:hypothetical protein n=1 Tax=Actinokineospora sp. TaxID=1872133 RepID=UPI004038030E
MHAVISAPHLRRSVADRLADLPAYEDRYWAIAAGTGVDRAWARRLLDVAVSWIGAGRADVVDPYALALSWLPR